MIVGDKKKKDAETVFRKESRSGIAFGDLIRSRYLARERERERGGRKGFGSYWRIIVLCLTVSDNPVQGKEGGEGGPILFARVRATNRSYVGRQTRINWCNN